MKALVTGGARSGKSGFAERLCMTRAPRACYIATAQAYDTEMKERIALHRFQRESAGYDWQTLEEAQALPELLLRLGGAPEARSAAQGSQPVSLHASRAPQPSPAPMVLVDCLTLWLSNVLLAAGEDGEAACRAAIDELAAAVERYPGPLVIVTNEVGDGIVPEYPLGRLYRDLGGIMNQRIARLCDEVFLVTAGIPIELKQLEYKL
ncbi:bifunctional adenosylcobinamide kinase/adenosylcobinamide-phosphate guanylyltransferase [Paenibacillus kribbensis]|uniref:bifunctional adenosylcobinamide kinase/adenosylcobinamide-phosphate guanylyltransferase n=1 Tax=Paenibacillus kribbensis TaxID=172713 RepID=UPI002DBACCDB|nr:bifunctional adenosylcobinamide kinase/adenosylcobinamide-phosphate guanylyltransferase [Paenibacillus kribbensis]MEC0233291.1 bifunctional adenosylcobinamide kinase/adenosylcobinamide-phosphate guanylyltransferase [Paenibacillus kribbensis]